MKRTMFCSLIKIVLAHKVRNKTLWDVTLEKTIINSRILRRVNGGCNTTRTAACSHKQEHADVMKRSYQSDSLHLICVLIHQTGHIRVRVSDVLK